MRTDWLPVAVALTTLATAAGAACAQLVQKGYRLGRWVALLSEQVLSNSVRLERLERRLEEHGSDEVREERQRRLAEEVNRAAKNDIV